MSAEMIITKEEAVLLTDWFIKNERDLPWRHTGDPYDVWLSEIMLQQTRVEAVIQRFIEFKKELPDIQSLADVDDQKLMKLWEGMGYYSRARNLKKCAQMLVNQYNGKLPADAALLRKLPGIGPYTAGAIASLAYGIPVPAVDGNVLRVLSRLFESRQDIRDHAIGNTFSHVIQVLYDQHLDELKRSDPSFVSHFNQGLMELGAIVCLPNGKPRCTACPWSKFCLSRLHGTTCEIPYRSRLPERKIIERTIFVIRDGKYFVLRKRGAHGLLAGLYEFPGEDQYLSKEQALHEVERMGFHSLRIRRLPDAKHVFTHLEWHMRIYEIQVEDLEAAPQDGLLLVNKKELAQFAVPSAFQSIKSYYSMT